VVNKTNITEMAKDGKILLVRKHMLFFVFCEFSNIFTGPTHVY